MLNGWCHCGEVGWTLDQAPKSVTACNCTICRRYGALWAYGYIGCDIQTTGKTTTYRPKRTEAAYMDILKNRTRTTGAMTLAIH